MGLKIFNFQSVDSSNPKVSKPLRTSKNEKEIEFLLRIPQENKKEKFQNLPQEFKPLGITPQNNKIEFDEN